MRPAQFKWISKKERVEGDEVRVSGDRDYLGCVDHIKNYGFFFK